MTGSSTRNASTERKKKLQKKVNSKKKTKCKTWKTHREQKVRRTKDVPAKDRSGMSAAEEERDYIPDERETRHPRLSRGKGLLCLGTKRVSLTDCKESGRRVRDQE